MHSCNQGYLDLVSTPVLRVLDRPAHAEELQRAGALLREGGLVAFPTETVYGIAVSARLPAAIERLRALKQRPADKPMTVMVADTQPILERCGTIPPKARALMQRFWPGPLTLVLPALADATTTPEGQSGMVGFRLPDHSLARGLVQAAGVPLLVPSANRSGEPPARTADEVLAAFPDQLDLVIDGGRSGETDASTVVQVIGDEIKVLREAAIPESRILAPAAVHLLFVCTGNTDRSPLAVAIVRRRLAERLGCSEGALPQRGLRIESAGVSATGGRRASRRVRQIAAQAFDPPLDLESHRSRKLDEELIGAATRIVCMEREQRDQILAFYPHRERDVFLLDPEGADVADPVGRSLATYERLARRLDAAASLIVATLLPTVR